MGDMDQTYWDSLYRETPRPGWDMDGPTPILAELLGMPHATIIMQVEKSAGGIRVKRELEDGWYQHVEMPLPALLTTALTFGEPRYASLKGIMGAKKKTISTLTLADLALDAPVGESGSKTELVAFAPPPVRGKGRIETPEDGAAGAKLIFDFLKEKKLV